MLAQIFSIPNTNKIIAEYFGPTVVFYLYYLHSAIKYSLFHHFRDDSNLISDRQHCSKKMNKEINQELKILTY